MFLYLSQIFRGLLFFALPCVKVSTVCVSICLQVTTFSLCDLAVWIGLDEKNERSATCYPIPREPLGNRCKVSAQTSYYANSSYDFWFNPALANRLIFVPFSKSTKLHDNLIIATLLCRCSVCLGNCEADDRMQQIPACGHMFPLDCIARWLITHTTCPLCRLSLLPSAKASVEPNDVQVEISDGSFVAEKSNPTSLEESSKAREKANN